MTKISFHIEVKVIVEGGEMKKRRFFVNLAVQQEDGSFSEKNKVVIAHCPREAVEKAVEELGIRRYFYPVSVVDGVSGEQYFDNMA